MNQLYKCDYLFKLEDIRSDELYVCGYIKNISLSYLHFRVCFKTLQENHKIE